MRLRRLTSEGVAQFCSYLDQLESEPGRLVPVHLLEDAAFSEPVGTAVEVQKGPFGSRYAAARYLDSMLRDTGVKDVDRDVGMWAWLTLLYFDEICPKDRSGARKPKERARYVPEPENYKRYYRHALLGAFLAFRAHRDEPRRAMALLFQPLHIIDDIIAQLAAYQEIISNKSLIQLATELYLDPVSGEPKAGARSKGAGSPRRLTAVLDQFDVTWDLYAMSLAEFWAVLPKEFDRFRPSIT